MKTVYEDNSQIHKQYEKHILRHKVAYENMIPIKMDWYWMV